LGYKSFNVQNSTIEKDEFRIKNLNKINVI